MLYPKSAPAAPPKNVKASQKPNLLLAPSHTPPRLRQPPLPPLLDHPLSPPTPRHRLFRQVWRLVPLPRLRPGEMQEILTSPWKTSHVWGKACSLPS
jgi:hypothetical protein